MPLSDNLSDEAIKELRVAGGNPPKEQAAVINRTLQGGKRVRLTAIGHQAVGQAIKSIPAVNQFCVSQGYLVTLLPSFSLQEVVNREAEDESQMHDRTIMVMSLIRISPQ
jgi:stage V sporulation protein SpoVS